VFKKAPEAGNILKTKGQDRHFSFPEAENILKIKPLIQSIKKWILHDKVSTHGDAKLSLVGDENGMMG